MRRNCLPLAVLLAAGCGARSRTVDAPLDAVPGASVSDAGSGGRVDAAVPTPGCGNGVVEAEELCDDGNLDDTDVCDTECGLNVHSGAAIASDGRGGFILGGAICPEKERPCQGWIAGYDAAGILVWETTYSDGERRVHLNDIAVGSDGEIAAAGLSYAEGEAWDGLVLRYGAGGDFLWAHTYAGPLGDDEADGVALDGDGNTIATGWTDMPGGNDLWLRKYDPSGAELWTVVKSSPSELGDAEGHSVVADSVGNVIVGGESWDGRAHRMSALIFAVGPDGGELWSRRDRRDPDANDDVADLALTDDDGVIVIGSTSLSARETDMWWGRYDSDGRPRWSGTFNGPVSRGDLGNCVAVAPNGQIFLGVNMTSAIAESGQEIGAAWVGRMAADGSDYWTQPFEWDTGVADIAADPDGNALVLGGASISGGWQRMWVRKVFPRWH